MAQDTIVLKLIVDDGQLKGATASIDKQSKAIDTHTKKQKQGTKTSSRYNKAEKALYQTNLSGSKAFSKMNQTMGGSGGVVAAYATLAANVFALTAAFGALSKAAEFETLQTGLVQLGAASGQTLSVMADGLREITGGAISVEEAMRGAALGVSGGFGGEQLEGLARIAKGASITLGRSLPDAFDRLTRGAIKLEPEILDELGIMVRLDDAVEDYAAQIGKTASSLTQMERRQAFMNAILVQGEAKFGAIADSVDPSPYARLGATFGDLTRKIFTVINKFSGLGAVVGFLADNVLVLFGVMVLFGSTLAGKMLPFLADTAKKARDAAKGLRDVATSAHEAQKITQRALAAKIGTSGVGSGAFKEIMGKYARGEIEGTKELFTAQTKLKQGITRLNVMKRTASAEEIVAHNIRIAQYETEILHLDTLIGLEGNKGKAAVVALNADLMAKHAGIAAGHMELYQAGIVKLGPTLKMLDGQFGDIKKGLLDNAEKLTLNFKGHSMYQKALASSTAWTTVLANKLKVLGAAFMKALPLIGLVTVAAGIAYFAWRKIFLTEEAVAYKKQLEKINKILENQAEIGRKYHESQALIPRAAARQLEKYKQISGVIKETNEALKIGILRRKLMDKSRPGESSLGMSGEASARLAKDLMFAKDVTRLDPMGDRQVIFESSAAERQLDRFGQAVSNMLTSLEAESREKTMAGILAIEDSVEWQSFNTMLNHDIPVIADAAAEHMRRILLEDMEPEERVKAIATAYEALEARLGNVGAAAQGIADGLKEAEKEASKFLTTFAKTTKVTELAKQMRAMADSIAFMKREMNKLDPGATTREVGIALSSTGTNIAKMVGPEFYNSIRRIGELQMAIQKLGQDELMDSEDKQANLDAMTYTLGLHFELLGKMAPQYIELVDTINDIERAHITTAQVLKQIASIQSRINKLKDTSINFSKQEHKLIMARLAAEKLLAQTTSDLIADQFAATKYNKEESYTIAGITLQKGDQVTLEQLKTLNAEQQLKLAKQLGIQLGLVYSKEAADILIITKQLEEERAILEKIHKEKQRAAEILKQQINLETKRNALLITRLTFEKQMNNFRSGMGTELTASQQITEKIKAAKEEHRIKDQMYEAEWDIIEAKAALQKIEIEMLDRYLKRMTGEGLGAGFMDKSFAAIDTIMFSSLENLGLAFENSKDQITLVLSEAFGEAMEAAAQGEGAMAIAAAVAAATDPKGAGGEDAEGKGIVTMAEGIGILRVQAAAAAYDLKQLGPTGEAYAEAIMGFEGIASGFQMIAQAGENSAQKVQGIVSVFRGMATAFQGISKAKVAALDQEIAAEEARDGKSKKSLDKIKAMKMKKYQIEKKAFELNKKVQLANAVVDGMAAIQSGLATKPFLYLGIAMGAMATAMTMLQIKAIQSQKFAGKPPDMSKPSTGEITVGKRTNKVDISKQASVGELAYLRGQRGIGTTATNFQAQGGAAGLRKGYASGGVLVGERGPETITPLTGLNVIPAGQGAKSQINANFTIHAIDAAGVEEVLLGQQGNIINMIRSAANDYGEGFLEVVDTDSYGDFSGNYGGG